MIDIESELFTILAAGIRQRFPGAYVTGEQVPTAPSFPCVSIVESGNMTLSTRTDSAEMENAAELTYEVEVFSNRVAGKKAECRAMIAYVDGELQDRGFERVFLQSIPNFADSTIYRMTARYRAVVDRAKTIYRR